VIQYLRECWDFALYVIGDTPALKDALQLYLGPCALGIYWTQGLKRAQRRNKWRGKEHLSSIELRLLSGGISGGFIFLMAWAFYALPMKQIVAHAVIGGAATPFIMWAVIQTLMVAGTRWDWARDFCDRLKTGDRRRREGVPPPGVPERRMAHDPNDETGEFWNNGL